MNLKTTFFLIFIIISFNGLGQVKEKNIRLSVLKRNIIGKEFVFNTEDKSTTYLTYLGMLHSKKGDCYKIVNSVWIWGQSQRATNRILVFDKNNKYLGNYPLTFTDELPGSIRNNKLVFNNKNGGDCDIKLITYLNFDGGIPNESFRKCAGNDGNVYTFTKNSQIKYPC